MRTLIIFRPCLCIVGQPSMTPRASEFTRYAGGMPAPAYAMTVVRAACSACPESQCRRSSRPSSSERGGVAVQGRRRPGPTLCRSAPWLALGPQGRETVRNSKGVAALASRVSSAYWAATRTRTVSIVSLARPQDRGPAGFRFAVCPLSGVGQALPKSGKCVMQST